MVYVAATIDVKPGQRKPFLDIFKENVPNVLAEEGCLAYAPAIDTDGGIAAQSPLRPDTVIVLEQWESLAHLHAHLEAPHMAVYRERVKDLVQKVRLEILEPA